jgi:hypothetical protein
VGSVVSSVVSLGVVGSVVSLGVVDLVVVPVDLVDLVLVPVVTVVAPAVMVVAPAVMVVAPAVMVGTVGPVATQVAVNWEMCLGASRGFWMTCCKAVSYPSGKGCILSENYVELTLRCLVVSAYQQPLGSTPKG